MPLSLLQLQVTCVTPFRHQSRVILPQMPRTLSVVRASETPSASASCSKRSVVESIKRSILSSVSNTNRGKTATGEQKQQILKLIEELEQHNAIENPVDSDLSSGSWALLYTSPVDEKTADKYAATEEGPFLARIKPLAFGTVKQTSSLQVIDKSTGTFKNIADFTFFGIKGSLCINGRTEKDLSPEKKNVRVQVTFESFEIKIGEQTVASVPLTFVNPRGWVDTTYLDEAMRVGRGDKGSVFVAVRSKLTIPDARVHLRAMP